MAIVDAHGAVPGVGSRFPRSQLNPHVHSFLARAAEYLHRLDTWVGMKYQPHLQRAAIVQSREVRGQGIFRFCQRPERIPAVRSLAIHFRRCLQPSTLPGVVDGVFNMRHLRRRIGPVEKPVLHFSPRPATAGLCAHPDFPDVAFFGPLQAVDITAVSRPLGILTGTSRLTVIESHLRLVLILDAAPPRERRDVEKWSLPRSTNRRSS